jgi:para-aminobenzoate synthetase component I
MKSIFRHEIPYSCSSILLFDSIRDMPEAIWLDSGKPTSDKGSLDIISSCPDVMIETFGNDTTIISENSSRTSQEDPFSLANKVLEPLLPIEPNHQDLPFVGGMLGYFGYDLGRRLIDIPSVAESVTELPDMRIGRFLWALIVNHDLKKSQIIFHQNCSEELKADVINRLTGTTTKTNVDPNSLFKLNQAFKPTLTRAEYAEAIGTIKDYIRSGDCYQTNFTQHFSTSYKGDPWVAYLALREALPSPFSAYWKWQEHAVLCISPERFLKVSNCPSGDRLQAETKPIKGTVPRGLSLIEDQERAAALVSSAKDRAENLMIVDLLRNDLGKNCIPGSVKVPQLFAVESFANVHHLVSTVTGDLSDSSSPIDLLRDCFPGGSITGAPKRRAMEIIEQLEPVRRSVYCGSIGYVSANNKMDTNIAIRTMLASKAVMHCWGGGGIVADSEAESEFEESMDKIKLLLKTLEDFTAT